MQILITFFADGDASLERLARMQYYVQQIEFEMYSSRPTIYHLFKKIFHTGVEVLQDGVTERFESSIVELKQKSLINKGILSIPKGKSLITQKEYDLEKLKKLEKETKVVKTKAPLSKPASVKPVHPAKELKAENPNEKPKKTTKPTKTIKK